MLGSGGSNFVQIRKSENYEKVFQMWFVCVNFFYFLFLLLLFLYKACFVMFYGLKCESLF